MLQINYIRQNTALVKEKLKKEISHNIELVDDYFRSR